MSKNLVKVNRFHEHPYYVESGTENIYVVERLTPEVGVYQISGPAIDRLFEFEKLGMEPEEIIKLKEENANLINERYEYHRKKAREFQSLNEDIKMLEEANNSLKQRNAEFVKENRSLKEKRRDLKINLDAAYKGLEKKNKTIESLSNDISEKDKKIQNFEISMEQLVDHIRTLETTDWCKVAKEQEAKIDELESENCKLRDLGGDYITLKEHYEKLRQEHNADAFKIVDARKVNRELSDELIQASKERDEWKHKYNHIFEHNDILMREVSKLKDKLKKATNHIASLKDQIKGFEYSESVEIRDLKTMNADLMKINDAAYKEVGILIEQNEALKEHVKLLERMKIKDLEIENKDLKAKMATINHLSDVEQPVWKKDIPCLVDISLMEKKGE